MMKLKCFLEITILSIFSMLSGCVIAGSDVPILSGNKVSVSVVVPTAESQIKPSTASPQREPRQSASDTILNINVTGYSDNIIDGPVRDKREAEIYAKRAACESGGVKLKSITRIKDLQIEDDQIESKCQAHLLPGYTFDNVGYNPENGHYTVILIGKIKTEQ